MKYIHIKKRAMQQRTEKQKKIKSTKLFLFSKFKTWMHVCTWMCFVERWRHY